MPARTEAAATASACALRRPNVVSQVIRHTSKDRLTLPLGKLLTKRKAMSSKDEDAGLVAARKRVRHTTVPGGRATVAFSLARASKGSQANSVGVARQSAHAALAGWDFGRVKIF